MNGDKLNVRFHDPNPQERSCAYVLRLLVAANRSRLEQALDRRGPPA